MKGKSTSSPRLNGNDESIDPEALALKVLNSLVTDPERLGRFLALSGLDPATIRTAAATPGFLPAILDHVAADERLLLTVADEIGVSPEAIMAAQRRLSPDPDWSP